jgi:hypothetical protein
MTDTGEILGQKILISKEDCRRISTANQLFF